MDKITVAESKERLKNLIREFEYKKDKLNVVIFAFVILEALMAVIIGFWGSSLAFFVIIGGALLVILVIGILIWFSKNGILYENEIFSLKTEIFGSLDAKDKELAEGLHTKWQNNYRLSAMIFKKINILQSIAIVLLARQISQELQALAYGLRLDNDEYQEFYKKTQKKIAFINKKRTGCQELGTLYQKSCVLLQDASYSLE